MASVVATKCDLCIAKQDELMESGDGSQVVCNHLNLINMFDDAADEIITIASTEISTLSSTLASSLASSLTLPTQALPLQQSRKRKFLSQEGFFNKADDKTKRRIAPIQQWIKLIVGNIYYVLKIHDIMVVIKGKEQLSRYGEFEAEDKSVINVWLTDIIYEELNKYDLKDDNVYIKPLGKRKSKRSGNDYHDFVVVIDNDEDNV